MDVDVNVDPNPKSKDDETRHDKKCSNKCFHFSSLAIISLDVDWSQRRGLLPCTDYNECTSVFLPLRHWTSFFHSRSLDVDLRWRNSRRPIALPIWDLFFRWENCESIFSFAVQRERIKAALFSSQWWCPSSNDIDVWRMPVVLHRRQPRTKTSLTMNSSTDDSQSEFSNHPSRPVRHLFLIRHGQYQRRRTQSDGHLTAKDQKQAWYTANFLLSQLPEDVLFDSLETPIRNAILFQLAWRRFGIEIFMQT